MPIRLVRNGIVAWFASIAAITAAFAQTPELHTTRLTEPVFRGEVQVTTAGPAEAPAVVLIHGIGEKAARDWDGLIPILANDYRVLTFDLPGFGRSSKDNAPYTPGNYATLVRNLVERELGRRPVRLVGHSLGGAIALRYASRHPQEVEALVLVDVPGVLHRLAYSKYLTYLGVNALPNLYPAQNDHLRNLTSSIFGWLERRQPAPEAIVLNPTLRKSLLNADPGKIAGLALAMERFGEDLSQVTVPTLLLWGGQDEIAPLRNGKSLQAMLPNARLEVFSASGHTPMDDVPESFNSRVVEFLRSPRWPAAGTMAAGVMQPVAAVQSGSCRKQRGLTYQGDYETLTLSRCRGVIIRQARIRHLRIHESSVTIEDSEIGGSNGGLVADDSRVTITSSRIDGKVAITAIGAHLDIAGSRITGREAAVRAPLRSELLFSISEIRSPNYSGSIHDLYQIGPDNPL